MQPPPPVISECCDADFPVSARRVFAIDEQLFLTLRKRSHLRRLVDTLTGVRDPADVGLSIDKPIPVLDLGQAWLDIGSVLPAATRPWDRWRADLHLYYLTAIEHRRHPAGYWSTEAVAWTLSFFHQLAEGLLGRAGKPAPPTERLARFTYLSRGNTEYVSNPVLGIDTLRGLRAELVALTQTTSRSTLGERALPTAEALWDLAAFMSEALAPQLQGGRPGSRWALLWAEVPGLADKPLSKPPLRYVDARTLMPVVVPAVVPARPPVPPMHTPPAPPRAPFPAGLDLDSPDSVVAYVRMAAERQLIDNPGQYHPADHFDALKRKADADATVFQAALDQACTTILRDTRDYKEADLVYHLTSYRSPRAFLEVLIERLERDDLPPPGPPLHTDLRQEFLAHASRLDVVTDPELRARFGAVAKRAQRWDVVLQMALRAYPDRDLLPALRGLSTEQLTKALVERIASVIAEQSPGELLEVAGALLKAPPPVQTAFAAEVKRRLPAWFEAHGERLNQVLAGPGDISDWR